MIKYFKSFDILQIFCIPSLQYVIISIDFAQEINLPVLLGYFLFLSYILIMRTLPKIFLQRFVAFGQRREGESKKVNIFCESHIQSILRKTCFRDWHFFLNSRTNIYWVMFFSNLTPPPPFWYCIAAGIDVKLFPYNLQDRAEYGGEDIKCFCRGGWNIYNPSRNFNGVFIEKAKHCKYHII